MLLQAGPIHAVESLVSCTDLPASSEAVQVLACENGRMFPGLKWFALRTGSGADHSAGQRAGSRGGHSPRACEERWPILPAGFHAVLVPEQQLKPL